MQMQGKKMTRGGKRVGAGRKPELTGATGRRVIFDADSVKIVMRRARELGNGLSAAVRDIIKQYDAWRVEKEQYHEQQNQDQD